MPTLERRALVWGHCHHRATGGMGPEHRVLGERMSMDVTPLEGGCCGLAGSWGSEDGKYQVSMDCGEQALLPAVRDADRDTVVVADGFSCKTQIAESGTGRRALHVSQVIRLARTPVPEGEPPERPELFRRPEPGRLRRTGRVTAVAAGAGAVMVAVVAAVRR